VGTSLPAKVYEITTNHIVRVHDNIINGYEKSMNAPPPTLCIARNLKRANIVKLHDSSTMKHQENLAHESIEYHQSYESHESTRKHFENL
jgi:hypothetical protein